MDNISFQSEGALVKSLIKGNLSAFNTLYNIYNFRLYQFANGYLKSEEEAEEVVQEVFFKIWEKRKALKEELSFKSFLFTIAFNIIRKHFRTKSQLIKYFDQIEIQDIDNNTTDITTYNSLKNYIDELINLIPPKRKEIFIKSRINGLSNIEIATSMNISQKTVENQITAALKFLRQKINEENLTLALFFTLFIN